MADTAAATKAEYSVEPSAIDTASAPDNDNDITDKDNDNFNFDYGDKKDGDKEENDKDSSRGGAERVLPDSNNSAMHTSYFVYKP